MKKKSKRRRVKNEKEEYPCLYLLSSRLRRRGVGQCRRYEGGEWVEKKKKETYISEVVRKEEDHEFSERGEE